MKFIKIFYFPNNLDKSMFQNNVNHILFFQLKVSKEQYLLILYDILST